jgi:hypothetical protein
MNSLKESRTSDLVERSQKALCNHVVWLVRHAETPNIANEAVKAAEYPNSVCAAARYLALLREENFREFSRITAKFGGDGAEEASYRIFPCMFSSLALAPEWDEPGFVKFYRDSQTLPIFWEMDLLDYDGYELATTRSHPDAKVGSWSYTGAFSEGSRSIPFGLQFVIWCRPDYIELEYVYVDRSIKVTWYRRMQDGSNQYARQATRIESGLFTKEVVTLAQYETVGDYSLIFTRKVSATGWEGQSFETELRMEYPVTRFDWQPGYVALHKSYFVGGDPSKITSGTVVISAKAVSDPRLKTQGHHAFYLAKSIGEMISAPQKINFAASLRKCFSFKFREVDMFKCLVPLK